MVTTQNVNVDTQSRLEHLLLGTGISSTHLSTRFSEVATAVQDRGTSYSTIDLLTTALAAQNMSYTGNSVSGRKKHAAAQRTALNEIYSQLDQPVANALEDLIKFRNTDVCARPVSNSTLAAKTVLYRNIASDLSEEVDTDLLSAARKLTSTGYSWKRKAEVVMDTLEQLKLKYSTLEFEEGSLNADIVAEMKQYIASNKILSNQKTGLQARLYDAFSEKNPTPIDLGDQPSTAITKVGPASVLVTPTPKSSVPPEAELIIPLDYGVRTVEVYSDPMAGQVIDVTLTGQSQPSEFEGGWWDQVPQDWKAEASVDPFSQTYDNRVVRAGTGLALAAAALLAVTVGPSIFEVASKYLSNLFPSNQTTKQIVVAAPTPDASAVETFDDGIPGYTFTSRAEAEYVLTAIHQSEEVPHDIRISDGLGYIAQNPIAVSGPNGEWEFIDHVEELDVSTGWGFRAAKDDAWNSVYDTDGNLVKEFHPAIDLRVSGGTELRSPILPKPGQDPFLMCKAYGPRAGNYITIHGRDDQSGEPHVHQFMHLSEFGEIFTQGGVSRRCVDLTSGDRYTVIAKSGATGRASGPHVHHKYVVNGVNTDPFEFYSLLQRDSDFGSPSIADAETDDAGFTLAFNMNPEDPASLLQPYTNNDGYTASVFRD